MSDARRLLPLNTLVFETLLALTADTRHGWDLVREIQQRLGGERVLPANFYRTLRGMLADGLIEDATGRARAGEDDERRRYFRLTAAGHGAAAAEARRLEAVVLESRAKKLLSRRG